MNAKLQRADYQQNPVALHRNYYGQFVTEGIRTAVVNRFGLQNLLEAYSEDVYFNTITLMRWDRLARQLHTRTLDAALEACGDFWSQAGAICILKEAAKQAVEAAASSTFASSTFERIPLIQNDGVWEPPKGSIPLGATLGIPAAAPAKERELVTVYAFYSDMEEDCPSLYTVDKAIVEHLKAMRGASDWIAFTMPEEDFTTLFSVYANRFPGRWE